MRPIPDQEHINLLRAHLERQYGVRVASLTPLDLRTFDTMLEDGRRWVTRVFPQTRPLACAENDAAVLRSLAGQGFPAERLADAAPVSSLAGRGILVTEYVDGTTPDADSATLQAAGALLAQVHCLPLAVSPSEAEAGALHHYVHAGGGPRDELASATSWLNVIAERVPVRLRAPLDALYRQLAEADTCQGLPLALIHPDPVLKNMLATSDRGLVLIDWTGVGRGPRLCSLAVLLWSGSLQPGGWSPARVDAIVAGYRAHVTLEPEEVARLAAVMRNRPLIFACGRYRRAVLQGSIPTGDEWWWPDGALADAIAERARPTLIE